MKKIYIKLIKNCLMENYVEKYTDYLPNNIYSLEFMKKIKAGIIKMYNLCELNLTIAPESSNCLSYIFIGKTCACQVFQYHEIYTKIRKLLELDLPNDVFPISNLTQKHISYDDENNIIIWKLLTPIKKLVDMKSYIEKNFKKFETDIKKALKWLHKNGYLHRDCTLDNIGIDKHGNFNLFDFDSIKYSENLEQFQKLSDYCTLNKSLKFNKINHFVDVE